MLLVDSFSQKLLKLLNPKPRLFSLKAAFLDFEPIQKFFKKYLLLIESFKYRSLNLISLTAILYHF